MDKFLKNKDGHVWEKDHFTVFIDQESGHVSFNVVVAYNVMPSTREEFCAAAMQAIEKIKARGIDIGTDWLPKWEPKVGEVVCAWDDACKTMKLGQYEGKSLSFYFPYAVGGQDWQHIAPFTGEIPEPFKSRWEAESDANQ